MRKPLGEIKSQVPVSIGKHRPRGIDDTAKLRRIGSGIDCNLLGRKMIVNDTHRFAFVHIPKCAGSTIRLALAPYD
ncbi:MAG TPA: hypothetical protein DIU07_02070 [Rhodobacteraceae bacterium]|nr:hypothetical protein [Paracoccaceae bacterium]